MIAVAVAVFAFPPFRIVAQAAQPDNAAASPAGATTAPAETHQSNEDLEKNLLLGGPIVKWTARTFNMSVEHAAWAYQIVNSLVLILLIGIPIGRVLPKILRKRSQTLGHSLRTAREATQEANSRLKAVEEKLAGLGDEIKKLEAQVEHESREDEVRVKASIAEESARIVESAEQELSLAAEQARRSLRLYAANLAIEQAAHQMQLTPETDRALISEFIANASTDGAGAKGGHN
jgi:F-type H+-transporting ATPase subunit b